MCYPVDTGNVCPVRKSTERHIMLTLEFIIAELVPQCGNDFSWAGARVASDRPSGGERRGGRPRVGMRNWFYDVQGGICPTCDKGMDRDITDLAHVFGSGSGRKGFVPGNIYLSHPACNVEVARAVPNGGYYTTLSPSEFKRPDLIQLTWPVNTVGAFIRYDPLFGSKPSKKK